MPRTAKMTKRDLAGKLLSVFKMYGYDGASLNMLAETTGLSKATLYHHFPRGKEDMATYVLGLSGNRLQKHVLAPLQSNAPAGHRLEKSFQGTLNYYDGKSPICLMNSLMIGDGNRLFGNQIREAVTVWQSLLAASFNEAGQSNPETYASQTLEQIQGALIMCKLEDSRHPLENCITSLHSKIPQTAD